jgi:hypothetical protein
MSLRKAFFPLSGERIEISGDDATLNGEPVGVEEAARLIDQRLGEILTVSTPPRLPPPPMSVTYGPVVAAAFAPLGSDPANQAAWTWL